jgi:hypothetical protein
VSFLTFLLAFHTTQVRLIASLSPLTAIETLLIALALSSPIVSLFLTPFSFG